MKVSEKWISPIITNLLSRIKKRKRILALLIILIFISILLVALRFPRTESESQIEAVILIPRSQYRLSEPIQFEAKESKRSSIQYHWEFGDGGTSDERVTLHQYSIPGHYNVSLLVVGENGIKDRANISIGIQRDDLSYLENINRIIWVANGRRGVGMQIDIGPNIGLPSIDITANLENVIGNIGISVWLEYDDDRYDFSESSYQVVEREYTISLSIDPYELPTEMETIPSTMDIFIWVDKGEWSGGTLSIQTTFPYEQ